MKLIDLEYKGIYKSLSVEEFLIKDSEGNSWFIEVKESPNLGRWQGYVYNSKRECRKTTIGQDRNLITQAAVDILEDWWQEVKF
jgi:hypothetical protein